MNRKLRNGLCLALGVSTIPMVLSQANAESLTTTFASNNGCAGNLFDVTTFSRPVTVTGLDINIDGSSTVTLYTRNGTYVGNETNPAAWSTIGSAALSGTTDTPTFFDVPDFNLGAVTTTGFHVVGSNTNMQYTNGANVYANADLQITTGVGTCGAFSGLNTPRTWNGTIYYMFLPFEQEKVYPAIQNIIAGNMDHVIGSLSDRMTAAFGGGREPAAEMSNPYSGGNWGTWMRMGGGQSDVDGSATGVFAGPASYDSTVGYVQGGIAAAFHNSADGRLVGSVFGHYSDGSAVVVDDLGALQGTVGTESAGLGASLTWLSSSGFYADMLALVSWHDIAMSAGTATGSTEGQTLAASLELGYSHRVNEAVNIVPQAQLVYQNTDIDTFTDTGGTTSEFSAADYFQGRFGVAVEHQSPMNLADGILKAHASVNVLHDFINDSGATVADSIVGFNAKGTELLVGGGVAVLTPANHVNIGLKGDYRIPLDDAGREGFDMSANVQVKF